MIKLHLHDKTQSIGRGWYERVWAKILDDGHAKLMNQPVCFPDIKHGDVVEVLRRKDGEAYADV